MKVIIKKSKAKGEINVPPSKSYAHRNLIAAFLSQKDSLIKNIDLSDDILATLSCLKELGAAYSYFDKTICFKHHNNIKDELNFDCLESGSTLRFLIPIALLTGKKLTFYGSEKLLSRGLNPYFKIFDKLNINYKLDKKCLKISGKLIPNNYEIDENTSSQFISGLLFALPLLNGDSTLKIPNDMQSKNYIDITLDVLKRAGIIIDVKDNVFIIKGNQEYKETLFITEGDYSNAAFLEAFNYIDGDVKLLGLNKDSLQGDKIYKKYFSSLANSYAVIDIANCIDLGPILFTFSCLFYGGHFINTKRLKIKESDRIIDLKNQLEKLNVKFEIYDNEVKIDNSNIILKEVTLNSCNDHRIVMALSLLLSRCGGVINNAECIKKSYPSFFEDLISLGIEVKKYD